MDSEPEDIVELARALYKRDESAWSEIYEKAKEDLHFLSDEPGAQWDDKGYQARRLTGRPALTVDQLSQFVHQVANDERQNTPTIDVVPAEDSDIEDARVIKEWIRGIEYKSGADDIYDTAGLAAIKCSIGFIRVDHDYCAPTGFDQELLIKRVTNQFACLIDSNSTECDGRDAMHGFVMESISLKEFEKKYPEATPISFEAEKTDKPIKEGNINIVEFFRITETQEVLTDGARKRIILHRTVKRYKLSGAEVLEETDFPGEYVPIVPVYGEEAWIDGKRHLKSLIRGAKDGQMMFNLWKSMEAELLLMQPRAPYQVAEGQITGYEDGYLNPGSTNVLTYRTKDIEGNSVTAPQRLDPPTIPTGIVNAARESVDDIKATMGLYNASIGQRSNETSGIAIARRKEEGDTATYHYPDNLSRSITQVGRILVSARKTIYDTERMIRTMDSEGQVKQVGINGLVGKDQERTYDFTKGDFDVRVITGPNNVTRRQESADLLGEVIKADPQTLAIIGDIWAANLDSAGSEALEERLKAWIKMQTPALIPDDENADPEKQQMAQVIQQTQQELQSLQQQLAQAGQQIESQDFQSKSAKAQSDLKLQYQQLQSAEKIASLTLQNQEKDMQLRAMQTTPEVPAPQQGLPAGLQVTKTPEQLQLEDAQHGSALMVAQQTHEQAMGVQQALAEQQANTSMMTANAIIQAVNGVKSSLDQLTHAVAQPKQVVYDANGQIIGVN